MTTADRNIVLNVSPPTSPFRTSKSSTSLSTGFEFKIRKKLVAVGDGAAGKTSLLWKMRFGNIPAKHTPTVMETSMVDLQVPLDMGGKKIADKSVTGYDSTEKINIEMSLWDTAGQEEYDRLRPLCYPHTDVVLLVCSVTSPDSLLNIKNKWIREVQHHCRGVPIILVGNKADKMEDPQVISNLKKEGLSMVSEKELHMVGVELKVEKTFLVSALTGLRVRELFEYAGSISMRQRKRKRPCKIL